MTEITRVLDAYRIDTPNDNGTRSTLQRRNKSQLERRPLPERPASSAFRNTDGDAIDATPWPDPPHAAAFYGLVGELVRTIEPHTEADPVALLVQTLVAFGNVIGRSGHFTAEADRHYTNLFAVLVGLTSKGRKGTSWGHIKRLMHAAEAAWAEGRIPSGPSSGEGLIWL